MVGKNKKSLEIEGSTVEDAIKKALGLLSVSRDEVNVKRIAFGEQFHLHTEITPPLKEEGMMRDFVRHVQEMRRDSGMKPKEKISLHIAGDKTFERVLEQRKKLVLRLTGATHLVIGGKRQFRVERELMIDSAKLWVGIR